jgi:drug/metabolite transporter (DMT)-like permease
MAGISPFQAGLRSAPFVVALGAHMLIPGERPRWLQVVGLLCAFAGTTLAFGDALRFPTYRELLGDGMAFVAAPLSGATTVVIKASRLARISPHKNLLYRSACRRSCCRSCPGSPASPASSRRRRSSYQIVSASPW